VFLTSFVPVARAPTTEFLIDASPAGTPPKVFDKVPVMDFDISVAAPPRNGMTEPTDFERS
jgi:hypothetical protein